jgi:hypothetical protein
MIKAGRRLLNHLKHNIHLGLSEKEKTGEYRREEDGASDRLTMRIKRSGGEKPQGLSASAAILW